MKHTIGALKQDIEHIKKGEQVKVLVEDGDQIYVYPVRYLGMHRPKGIWGRWVRKDIFEG